MNAAPPVLILLAVVLGVIAICGHMNHHANRYPLPMLVVAAVLALLGWIAPAGAHDNGQWDGSDPAIREWYRGLMQPDNPSLSCCGTADAYWCDAIKVRQGKTYCTITDDRDDKPLGRPHLAIGTEFEIPNHKLKFDRSNPTGHAIIFVAGGAHVLCFVQGTLS